MRAKAKPFTFVRVTTNYDSYPHQAVLQGLITIEGSPQGNSRPIFARLTQADAERLEQEIHSALLNIKHGPKG